MRYGTLDTNPIQSPGNVLGISKVAKTSIADILGVEPIAPAPSTSEQSAMDILGLSEKKSKEIHVDIVAPDAEKADLKGELASFEAKLGSVTPV